MQASILDLRRNMSEVLRSLERGERVTILHRGKTTGVLIPVNQSKPHPDSVCEHTAFGLWADREDLEDTAAHVRSLRRGRFG